MLRRGELDLEDYLSILHRRWWILLVTAIAGAGIATLISLILPDQYTSQTLVLVERPTVPDSYVKPVVTAELNQRLASMQEQILSRSRLQPTIERFGLYRKDIKRVPMEELVSRLRKSILVTPVQPMPGTQDRQLPGFAIAVTLNDARLAQQVCAEVTSMFMDENLRLRQQQAEETTQFLSKQLDEAKAKLDEKDAKLAAFKQRHIGELPDQAQTNLNLLSTANTQLEAVTQALNRAHQDKAFTESMLAQELAVWKSSREGYNPETLEEQLHVLQDRLVTLRARYTDDYPDVAKTKGDIAELKKKIAETSAEEAKAGSSTDAKAVLAEPPQIQQLRAQLHQYEQTIREKSAQQEQLQKQLKNLEEKVQLSPVVEQEFKELTRDYQTALEFYNDLLKKRDQSAMATDLERRQQGEQFRVLDPASLPDRPSFPNRPLFAGGGFAAGLALGLGLAMLLEMRDKSLRSERDVEISLQVLVLASIPSLEPLARRTNGVSRRAETASLESSLKVRS